MVIKPTPTALIGPTLIAFNLNREDDLIPLLLCQREYKVHLFGKEIRLESLVSQEQDKLTSVCATVSIFSVLHKLSELFRLPTPSTSTISEIVGISHTKSNRIYRNEIGLTSKSIAHIFRYYGLETISKNLNEMNFHLNESYIQYIYAYAKSKIPIILSLDISSNQSKNYHSVVVVGVLFDMKKLNKINGFNLFSRAIKKILVHDEGSGPFLELSLDENLESGKVAVQFPRKDRIEFRDFIITGSIIPNPKYIKVNHSDVITYVKPIDRILRKLLPNNNEVMWDVYLNQNIDFKEKQLKLDQDPSLNIKNSQFRSYPRYLWVADCYIERIAFLTLVFDSSMPNYVNPIFDKIIYNQNTLDGLINVFKEIKSGLSQNERLLFQDLVLDFAENL
jgi:hypothetical protein